MGFKESMVKDGFQDEKDYLEHLMEVAEEYWLPINKNITSIDDIFDEDEGTGCDLSEEGKLYVQWGKANPLLRELFNAWYDYETDSANGILNFDIYIGYFLIWSKDIKYYTSELEKFYGKYFPRILSYFKWKTENKIENILRVPSIDIFDDSFPPKIASKTDILIREVEDYEFWLTLKCKYNAWRKKATELDIYNLAEETKQYDFNGDTSIEHVRACIVEMLKKEKVADFERKIILDWYDAIPEQSRDFYIQIKYIESMM